MRIAVDLPTLLGELGASAGGDRAGAVEDLADRLAGGRLRVAVVGEAKRGKSSLANALLGTDLLPTGVTPLTAVATTVRHGSPPRVVATQADGAGHEYPLRDLWDLVTEAGNPANRRRLASVIAYLDAPLLSGGVEIVDTPGVGSVFANATTEAQQSHEQLDAAIFVLSVDPPMSASERDLLAAIGSRAVAIFVVLNKVDRLTDAERSEALRFTAAQTALALGGSVPVYPVSAAGALAAINRGDPPTGDLAGLDKDLVDYLTTRRDHDLARSVAGHATRIARSALDEILLTQRAADLAAENASGQVAAFRARLDVVDEHRRDAADIVQSTAVRILADLNDAYRWETPAITSEVHTRLADALAGLTGSPRQVEAAGRELAAAHASRLVGAWRAGRYQALRQRLGELDARLTRALAADLDAVRTAARDLLHLDLALPVPQAPDLPLAPLDERYDPDVGTVAEMAAALRHRLPGRLGRRRVYQFLLDEADDLVPRKVGRTRAAFQDALAQATAAFKRSIDHRYAQAVGGLSTALANAQTLAAASAEQAASHRSALSGQADTLRALLTQLAAHADPTPMAGRAATGQPGQHGEHGEHGER